MACISGRKCKENVGTITDHQLRQALEYFNLPECMWPTGLYIIHTHEIKCDKVANELMAAITAAMKKLVANDRHCASSFTKTYNSNDGEHGLSLQRFAQSTQIQFSPALKSRLTALAATECLQISFEPSFKHVQVFNTSEIQKTKDGCVRISVCIP